MLLRRAQIICRPHTEPNKFLLDILANNSSVQTHTDLRLGQVVYLSIFYDISNSWLQAFSGFHFSFQCHESENHKFTPVCLLLAFIYCHLLVIHFKVRFRLGFPLYGLKIHGFGSLKFGGVVVREVIMAGTSRV